MPYRDITVGKLLSALARDLPDREALVYSHAGRRWTFCELHDEAVLVARGLLAHGVQRGDRVALWATNVPEWIILQFALAKIGAILVTVNTSLKAAEIEYLLTQNETSTLITIGGFRGVDYLQELRQIGAIGDAGRRSERLPHLQRVIFIGDSQAPGARLQAPASGPQTPAQDELIPFASVREAAAGVPAGDVAALEDAVGLDDVINMQYTSGTTGFPKGVMLTSRNIVNNGY